MSWLMSLEQFRFPEDKGRRKKRFCLSQPVSGGRCYWYLVSGPYNSQDSSS